MYAGSSLPVARLNALIEAKDNNHAVGDGIQQGFEYGAILDIPFVFSSNGDGFLFHDRTGQSRPVETEVSINAFPSPYDLWQKYRIWKGLAPAEEEIILQNYFEDSSGKEPRYYQRIAINRVIDRPVNCWIRRWFFQEKSGIYAPLLYGVSRPVRTNCADAICAIRRLSPFMVSIHISYQYS